MTVGVGFGGGFGFGDSDTTNCFLHVGHGTSVPMSCERTEYRFVQCGQEIESLSAIAVAMSFVCRTILNQRHGTMPCPLRWKVHRLTR